MLNSILEERQNKTLNKEISERKISLSGNMNIDIINEGSQSKLQNNINKLTQDFNTKFNNIEDYISKENNKLSLLNNELQSNIEEIQRTKESILKLQQDLSTKITNNSNIIKKLNEKKLFLTGNMNIDVINKTLQSKLENDIYNLTQDFNNKFNNIQSYINQEDKNINNINQIIDNIKSKLELVKISDLKKFNLLDNEIQSNIEEIQNTKKNLLRLQQDLSTKISKNSNDIDTLQNNIPSIKEIEQNKKNILNIEKDLSTKITSNSNSINILQDSVSKLQDSTRVIGGINLISQQSNFGPSGSTSNEYGFNYAIAHLYSGRTYTFTVCGQSTEAANKNGQKLSVYIYNPSWSVYKQLNFEEITPTIKQVTFTVEKDEKYIIGSYASPSKTNSENVTIYWYNLQEGEIGTSWVPSLYDLSNIIGNKDTL